LWFRCLSPCTHEDAQDVPEEQGHGGEEFEGGGNVLLRFSVNDGVMGGVSKGGFERTEGNTLLFSGDPVDPATISAVGFTIADKKAGPFRLEVEYVKAVFVIDQVLLPPVATIQTPAPAALIARAIELGVPLFNRGTEAACAAVYEIACEALLGMSGVAEDSRKDLAEALVKMRAEKSAHDKAWTLRRAMDRVLSRRGLINHEAIAAAKAGVEGLALAAAASYARYKVRVNCVAPGLTRTGLTVALTENAAVAKASAALHPLGRIGEPAEVASAICWLLDRDRSSWATGQVIGVDGGLGNVQARA